MAAAPADDIRIIDVEHLGNPKVIGCWQVGDVLIDPGPTSSLDTLLAALDGAVPRALLCTHIHLDHAGGAGVLVQRWPDLEVYVHAVGAPHLADPSRLWRSATRLYGEENMARLWGVAVPVPEANLRVLAGEGESILDGAFRVRYTPGHASHHVSYLHPASGQAFVGDVAGVRIPPAGFVGAPTPPPDIDVEAWERSMDLVADWQPSRLGLTHFGAVDDISRHLTILRARLRDWADRAREQDEATFVAGVKEQITAQAGAEDAAAYVQAMPPDQVYMGLRRYWDSRGH